MSCTYNDASAALYLACKNGHQDIAEMLIANGANIDQADNDGRTPLYAACLGGNKNIVAVLLTAGAAVPPRDLRRIRELFPEIALTPDSYREGHFILTASDPMVHVNAVNQKFTESLPALLGDAITHETVLPQLIASLYEAEFVKALQKNFGEGTKVSVFPRQQKVFEDEALALAGNFMTIQTFTPSLDTPPAPAIPEERKWQGKIAGKMIQLFPEPQGRVISLQKIAAQSFATALVNDGIEILQIEEKEKETPKENSSPEKEEGQESPDHSHVGNIQKERSHRKRKRCSIM